MCLGFLLFGAQGSVAPHTFSVGNYGKSAPTRRNALLPHLILGAVDSRHEVAS